MPDPRFEMKRITDAEWLILDHRYGVNDARRTVACVYQVDPYEVETVWLRELPLARSYTSAADVLEDVQRFHARPRRVRSVTSQLRPASVAALA